MKLRVISIAVMALFIAACGRDSGAVLGHFTFSAEEPPSFETTDRITTVEIEGVIWSAKVQRSSRLSDPITIQLEIDADKHPSTAHSLSSYKKLNRPYTTEELKTAISEAFELPMSSVTITQGVIPSIGGPPWEVQSLETE